MNPDLPQIIEKIKQRVIALPLPAGKFPSIPLTIPEALQPTISFFTGRMFLFNFMIGFLFMAVAIIGQDIQENRLRLAAATAQRQALVTNINQWQAVVGQYPGYRDGYYQLAVLEGQLGNKQLAYGYIIKALQIDPDFKEGKEFLGTLTQ